MTPVDAGGGGALDEGGGGGGGTLDDGAGGWAELEEGAGGLLAGGEGSWEGAGTGSSDEGNTTRVLEAVGDGTTGVGMTAGMDGTPALAVEEG